ncbi:cytochrome P450 [Gloeopeniophorella convolvens]|nr:cytochrome P450 [Gloeopeniophorella convolvens]
MVDESDFRALVLASIFSLLCLYNYWCRQKDALLERIPTVGYSDPLLSYISALRFVLDGGRMLKEGYEMTPRGSMFKIPTFTRWLVLPVGLDLVEDIRRAPDDVLSFRAQVKEALQLDYTTDILEPDNSYHAEVVRSKLTRNIPAVFEAVRDELVSALNEYIPATGIDWVTLPILGTIQRAVCRTSNRVFVGAPLCRDPEYQKLNLTFAVNVVKFATIIGLFPRSLKPLVKRLLSNLPAQVQQEIDFVRPIAEERLSKLKELGKEWDDKPNDMLMWLINEARGTEKSVEGLARRLLVINFAAIHTTSLTATQALYRLLNNPQHIEPLRQDIEAAVAEEGWTKAAMNKMTKLDSFLRETQRLDGLGTLGMRRRVLRPFTFSNGITIPAGTDVAVPMAVLHRDAEIHHNAEDFDGFRFAKLRARDGDTVSGNYQSVSTSPEHLSFGYGRHACPGRFFATNEIKVLIAHLVVSYDMKVEDGKSAPPIAQFGSRLITRGTNVMFRRRQK